MFFHAKMGILGKNLYVIHTLFILYFNGNHTLFGEKLYFIWKFSSGKVSVSASHMVGCGFASRLCHTCTKDHNKNGTNCLPALHACVRVGV